MKLTKRDRAIIKMFDLSEYFRSMGYDSMDECLENETIECFESILIDQCGPAFELELAEFTGGE